MCINTEIWISRYGDMHCHCHSYFKILTWFCIKIELKLHPMDLYSGCLSARAEGLTFIDSSSGFLCFGMKPHLLLSLGQLLVVGNGVRASLETIPVVDFNPDYDHRCWAENVHKLAALCHSTLKRGNWTNGRLDEVGKDCLWVHNNSESFSSKVILALELRW